MNRYLIVFLIVLVIEAATLCALKIVYYEDEKHKVETVWYSIEEKKLSVMKSGTKIVYCCELQTVLATLL